MKKLFSLLRCSFMLMFILLFFSTTSEAADSMSVGVSAVIPDNQVDKGQTYFDLLMKPGQEQDVEIKLSNSSDEDKTVNISINPGTTNDNGVAEYNTKVTSKNKDSSLKVPISDIVEYEKEVVIPKKSEVKSIIKIKMPSEAYDGVIVGGIRVSEKGDSESKKDEDEKAGVQINNKFVYTIGLQLRTKESLDGIKPDLVLDKKKILPKQVNFRNVVGINLQNTQPIYIRDLEVEAKIYKKGSKEVLHETKKTGLKMSPNSNFNFGVDWENKELQGGDYVASVRAYSKDYDQEWKWDNQEFHIDAETAKKLNEKAVGLEKDNTKLYIMIGIGLILLLLIIILLIVLRNKKKRKKRGNKKKANKSKKHSSKTSSSKNSQKKSSKNKK
ncbi:DUF916 and DUF3324 domain-containing protein [Vagococcus sp. JNUCC 83]